MPNYDFDCASHGTFEDMSSFDGTKVQSVPCPKCGELAPVVWRRSPAMRKPGIPGVRFGGHTYSEELVEQKLAEKPADDDAGFWDDPGFEADYYDKRDQKTAQYFAGELPPILTDEQMTTLKQSVAGD